MKKKILIVSTIISMSLLSCRPVFAIGWREMFFIFILVVIVFGPPLYRFLRRLEKAREEKRERDI